MSLTRLPAPALPAEAEAEIGAAVAVLEGASLAIRLAALVGDQVAALQQRLPGVMQQGLDRAVRAALAVAMAAAVRSAPGRRLGGLPDGWLHRGLLAAAGAAGGAFGLAGTLAELPVSTTLLLRQVAAIAAAQGEELADPETRAECLKVFALGGRDRALDAAEAGYFALRLALAETLQGAAVRGLAPGFLGAVAARFGGPVAVKLSAQAAPFLGAAGGAAVNLAFLGHFRAVATAHFTIRRLERRHGALAVRAAYDRLRRAAG